MLRPILLATLIAGTLDILSAFGFSLYAGGTIQGVLGFVASGPFGDAAKHGDGLWWLAGLGVHFAIMACMAAAYLLIAPRIAWTLRQPILAGILYGILLWLIMYWIVRPLRWDTIPLPINTPNPLWAISTALFSHCLLVGIPIALVAARTLGNRRSGLK